MGASRQAMASRPYCLNALALRARLDVVRTEKGMSWREVAKEIGVSDPVFSQMARGTSVHADVFVSIMTWLGEFDIRPYVIAA